MVEPAEAAAAAPVHGAPSEGRAYGSSLWRRWHLEWLAPVAAAAAAVIVWIVLPRETPERVTESARVETQETASANEPQPLQVPPAPAVVAEPPAAPAPAIRRETAPPAAPISPPPAEAEAKAELRAAAEVPAQASRVDAAAQRQRVADQADAVQAGATAAAAPSPASAPAAGGAGAGRGGGAASVRGFGSLAAANAGAAPGEVISPDPAIRWRFHDDGRVEVSTNAGATWDRLESGVTGELVAGSSPSSSTCWIVGRGGLVIVTTDMRTWRRVGFPEPVDLARVQALDARTATVTAADGRTWRTTDGGAVWVGTQGF
jgi:hypothetical protein